MAVNKRLLQGAAAAGGITPSEHFGVVLYEGDGSSPHSINGGKFGAAAYTANSGVVTLPDNVIDANNHSVSIWFYANNLSGEQHLMELDETNRIIFRISSPNNNDWCYIGNSGYFDHGLRFNTGQWYHIVITFSNGNPFKIYRNGSLEYTGGNTNLFANNSNNDVGAGSSTGTANVEGKIDQLRIFHKELSASEVSTLYAETAATVESLSPLGNETVDTLQVLGDTSCVALYKLENNEDDKSGNYNGTGTEIQYAAGRYGQGAIFLDSDSKINIPDNFGAEGETVSYSLWFKTTSADGSYMFAKRTGNNTFHIRIDNGYAFSPAGKICVNNWAGTNQAANNAVSTSGGYNDGSWHHFVFTYDGNQTTKTKCFIDGVYDSGMDWTYDLSTQSVSGGNNIGNYDLNSSNFSGTIDQVRVFNKTLSASEVTTLYQENALVASYRFEGNANDDMRTYDGTASNVTYEYGLNFTPDFIWIKERTSTSNNVTFDSTRGIQEQLYITTAAQSTNTSTVLSFDSGGFSLGIGTAVNETGQDYVGWCLKANGGTTSSNTDGTITSTVQANQDSGFSIVKYTGTGSAATVGHGLSSSPEMVIVKNLSSGSTNWWTWHKDLGGGDKYVALDSSSGVQTASTIWNSTSPTSSVFSVGTDSGANGSGTDVIAYCFHSVDSFSKIGSYVGNGSNDGTFVETGFEPAFLMVKDTSQAADWNIFDNKRDTYNSPPMIKTVLKANTSAAEGDQTGVKFYSNGFSVHSSSNNVNYSGDTYIYMAFAADPDTEAPTVAKSFSTVTYTGTGADPLVIDGLGFKPGLVWIKTRDQQREHILSDIVRGPNKEISSNDTSAEEARGVKSFDDDGFTLDNATFNYNNNGEDYVAWTWKADDNEPTAFFDSAVTGVYKFEDNVNDVSGINNGASAVGLTYTSSGKFNKAVVSSGTNGEVSLSQTPPMTTAWTFSFWFYATDLSGTDIRVILQTGTGFAIGTEMSKIYIFTGGSNRGSGTSISANTWYHYAATYDGTSVKTYLNGSLAETITTLTGMSAGNLKLFDPPYASWNHYAGRLDQLRVYSVGLSSTQITALYNESVSDNDTVEFPDGLSSGPFNSLVSANANAGFSIVKWTGDGVQGSKVSHGLSAAPELIIMKDLSATNHWVVGNSESGWTKAMHLDLTSADNASDLYWDDTAPTATVFSLGHHSTAYNVSGNEYIAYCWHSVSGYSKIGSYTGTGTTNSITGLGFQPDWLMIKRATGGSSNGWVICDSVRGVGINLRADTDGAEADESAYTTSFDSDGFTLAQAGGNTNVSGSTYIYMAFKIN